MRKIGSGSKSMFHPAIQVYVCLSIFSACIFVKIPL